MFIFGKRHPSYKPLRLAKKSYPNCHWSIFDDFSFWKVVSKSCKIEHFSTQILLKIKFFKNVLKKIFYFVTLLFRIFEFFFFENYLSENLIIRNWFMSVGIRLKVFVIQLSLESGIRFYRSIFLVSDLDECYHLKVLNAYFGKRHPT